MASTTSGLTSFYLDVDDIIDQAMRPIGGDYISGTEASDNRRLLNLILIQLHNKDIPLNKIDTITQNLVASTQEYTLDTSINDVLSLTLELDGTETPLTRYSVKEFNDIPTKSTTGRPTLYCTERGRTGLTLKLWPIPNDSDYDLELLVSKKIEDVTAAYQRLDLPSRYLPLIIKWLSYEIALSKPSFPLDRMMKLEQEYLKVLPDTLEEDRERVDMTIVPGGIKGY